MAVIDVQVEGLDKDTLSRDNRGKIQSANPNNRSHDRAVFLSRSIGDKFYTSDNAKKMILAIIAAMKEADPKALYGDEFAAEVAKKLEE